MKHSNRHELEEYYQEQLYAEREAKRLSQMQGNNYDDEDDPPKKAKRKSIFRLPCCLTVLFITALALYIIYFVYVQVKDPLVDEFLENRDTIEQAPAFIQDMSEEARKKIEAGQAVLETAQQEKEKFDNLKDKVTEVGEILVDDNLSQSEPGTTD